jgi:endoglucanase
MRFGMRMVVKASLFLFVLAISVAIAPNGEESIRINQIGFYPDAPKKAVVAGKKAPDSFYVVNRTTDERIFKAKLGDGQKSQYSDETIRMAYFSSFTIPGRYRLFVPSVGYSYPFRIGTNLFNETAKASLRGYYFQRASVALSEKFAGQWSRKEGHPDDSVLVHESAESPERPEGTVINSSRGWYDAGDYNKYVVNSGISMATLMSLYEDFPDYVREVELNIPEQKNETPDLLDEILWNLRWMLNMQDPSDGGVYHKMTSPGFSGKVMPHQDRDKRYVVQKSTAAALNFAAVMAQASRVFEDYEQQLPGLADSCRAAASRAWDWAQQHPEKVYDQEQLNEQYDPDITTGAYGDENLNDEFFWAASELYVTTGDETYLESAAIDTNENLALPSWSQVKTLGYYTLLRFSDQLPPEGQQMASRAEDKVVNFANDLVKGGKSTAYQTVMGYKPEHFIWGSNSVAGNQAVLLIQAYRQTGEAQYLEAALSNMDYLLGRNATGYSFLTGFGEKPPMHPHHRPSEADSIRSPIPGLLVGGPNAGQQDGCQYPSDLANQSYVDDWCSYASNEITINWNAPFAYLAVALESIMSTD